LHAATDQSSIVAADVWTHTPSYQFPDLRAATLHAATDQFPDLRAATMHAASYCDDGTNGSRR
jgi:hypothetical protein